MIFFFYLLGYSGVLFANVLNLQAKGKISLSHIQTLSHTHTNTLSLPLSLSQWGAVCERAEYAGQEQTAPVCPGPACRNFRTARPSSVCMRVSEFSER
jgi:hypothetical protein